MARTSYANKIKALSDAALCAKVEGNKGLPQGDSVTELLRRFNQQGIDLATLADQYAELQGEREADITLHLEQMTWQRMETAKLGKLCDKYAIITDEYKALAHKWRFAWVIVATAATMLAVAWWFK